MKRKYIISYKQGFFWLRVDLWRYFAQTYKISLWIVRIGYSI